MSPTVKCDETPASTAPDFKKDGQEFFKYFDKVQDDLDEDMIRRLKDGLDGLLVYAGLFAAVNAAFLIYTLPNLKPDPVEDTNALLFQLIQLTISPNESTTIQYPSLSFDPQPSDLFVNRLFSLSLSLSLLAAFFVVWGKQWLGKYQAKNGAGVERWDQLNRARSAKRWGLVPTLELLLPLTLLSSLVIFSIGLGTYVAEADSEARWYSTFPLWLGYLLVMCASAARLHDPWCPYYTPVNAIGSVILRGGMLILIGIGGFVVTSITMVLNICNWFCARIRGALPFQWAWRARRWDSRATALQTVHEVRHSLESAHSLDTDLEREGSRQANLRRGSGISDDDASDRTFSQPNQASTSKNVEATLKSIKMQWRAVASIFPQPRTQLEALHGDAIVQILNVSREAVTLYHTAASICSISNVDYLNAIFKDKFSRKQLKVLFRNAARTLARAQEERTQGKDRREMEKCVAVFGTALLHLHISVGSWRKLLEYPDIDLIDPRAPPGTAIPSQNSSQEDKLSCLKGDLALLWNVLDGRLGHQPSFFTSTCVAAGLLRGSLDPGVSIFYETSKTLSFQLDSIASMHPSLWSQLSLLVLVCNTKWGGMMNGSSEEFFPKIQNAYTTTQSAEDLSDAVYQALRSHVGEKTRLPSDVFKLAWRLFVQEHQHKDAARALGSHVPFLSILEAKVRDGEKPTAYREYFQSLRSECFKVVLDTVRSFPYSERLKGLASWQFQAKFVFKAVGNYATSIMALGDARHVENREALGFIRGIRALVPPIDPARADPAHAQSASETEYRSEVKTFEETYERFESFIRSGQIKPHLAPEDQWCFSRTSWSFQNEE